MMKITLEEMMKSVKAEKPLTEEQLKIAQETMKKIQNFSPEELNDWLNEGAEDDY